MRVVISIVLSLIPLTVDWELVVAQPSTKSPPVGKITEANGEVLLQRRGRSQSYRPSVGTDLYPGDLLQKKGGTVIVFCYANRQPWRVPEGVSGASNGCPPNSQPILTPSGPIGPTRSPDSPVADIISPRRSTALLDDKPTLRWYPVPGAKSYMVRVKGTGGVDWNAEVSTTEIVYPGKPPLQPAGNYSLTVKADNGESVQEVFSLLNPEKAQQVRTEIEQIANQNLSEEAKTLILVSDVYLRNDLIAEAITKLENLVAQKSQTVAVYHTLGGLYGQVGLVNLAKDRYLQAVELAKTAKDGEGQATAQEGLGAVYEAMGDLPEAINWLNQAKTGYETLGDKAQVTELEQQLHKLQTQLQESKP